MGLFFYFFFRLGGLVFFTGFFAAGFFLAGVFLVFTGVLFTEDLTFVGFVFGFRPGSIRMRCVQDY